MGELFLKDPGAVLDYHMDWSPALSFDVSLASSGWDVTPVEANGLAVVSASLENATAIVCLSGGVAGHVYRVSNAVTMSDGRMDGRSVVVRVEKR